MCACVGMQPTLFLSSLFPLPASSFLSLFHIFLNFFALSAPLSFLRFPLFLCSSSLVFTASVLINLSSDRTLLWMTQFVTRIEENWRIQVNPVFSSSSSSSSSSSLLRLFSSFSSEFPIVSELIDGIARPVSDGRTLLQVSNN